MFDYDTKEKEHQNTRQSDSYSGATPPRTNQIASCFGALSITYRSFFCFAVVTYKPAFPDRRGDTNNRKEEHPYLVIKLLILHNNENVPNCQEDGLGEENRLIST
jgi:hypothetical protein